MAKQNSWTMKEAPCCPLILPLGGIKAATIKLPTCNTRLFAWVLCICIKIWAEKQDFSTACAMLLYDGRDFVRPYDAAATRKKKKEVVLDRTDSGWLHKNFDTAAGYTADHISYHVCSFLLDRLLSLLPCPRLACHSHRATPSPPADTPPCTWATGTVWQFYT